MHNILKDNDIVHTRIVQLTVKIGSSRELNLFYAHFSHHGSRAL